MEQTVEIKESGADVAEEEGELSPWKAYFRLWSFASPFDLFLRLLGAGAALGGGSAYPLMTLIFGSLVNAFNDRAVGLMSPADFRSKVNHQSLWFIYLFVGKFSLLYFADFIYCFTARRMAKRIRLQYLEKVLQQSIPYFDRHTPGSIATNLSTDTNIIEVGLADKICTVCQASGMIITAFVIAFTKSWKLTLVVGTTIPYIILVTMGLSFVDSKLQGKMRAAYTQATSIAEEALGSVVSATSLGAIENVIAKFRQPLFLASRYGKIAGPIEATIYGNMFFSIQSGYALALFYGVKLVDRGEIHNGGTVMVVLLSVLLGSSAMGMIAPSIPSFLQAGGSAQQVLKLLQPKISETRNFHQQSGLRPQDIDGEFILENVSFSYPQRPSVSILGGLSLTIPAGKVTAIVGYSGSGKSTIISLVERWYIPTKGRIYLDGRDIQKLDLKWLRSQIGLVQQDPTLFNDSISENVLNGLRASEMALLTENEKQALVIDACKQANAHEFIQNLPHGYDTNVGERASLLSGGQKQRIAIARSIISNPKILLLDEATSALDSESEKAVEAALEKASLGRTILMIAHKLSNVERADKIVVVRKGRIVEEGTHASLLALNGAYCRLLHAQSFSTPEEAGPTPLPSDETSHQLTEKAITNEDVQLKLSVEVAPNLESKSIARRISLPECIVKILWNTPKVLPAFFGGTVGAFVAGATMPLQAYFFSKLVTVFQLSGSARVSRGDFWAGMFFTLALANLISYAVLWWLFSIAGSHLSLKYRTGYLRSFLNQDLPFFEVKGHESGALAALLSTDGDDFQLLFSMSLALIIVFAVDITACGLMAIGMGWRLGLVGFFGCYPFLIGAGYFRLRMETTAQDRCAAGFLESARFGTEAIEAIKTVSSLNMESKVIERYGDRLRDAVVASSKRMVVSMALYALSDSLDFLPVALVFWYGGRLVSLGELSTGNFFAIYSAIIFGGQGAGYIFGYSTSIAKAHAAANRMLYMQDRKAVINDSTGVNPHKVTQSEIIVEFHDVHFRYPKRPDAEVLRGLNLTIHQGQNICIVGPSGCGKSTIITLLERFYDITSGSLLIHGISISNLDIKALRSTIGLVSQETHLYQGTIRENLCMGISGPVNEDTLISACKDAYIHDFIASLPSGYETDCGPRGLSLSGGQRQRLAIARALLRQPEILLLDEATSALDPESQSLVADALKKASKGRTMIYVTHQIDIMKGADMIFVVDRGRVVELGRYEELMAKGGRLLDMMGEIISQA
ncbi:hypothetical protein EG329_013222 [Mollisiaceae sp. DMI_Dod_QoI]|nr:hypothetical protein EG329_013222 [Helotiales sp. DMI_Dod_QoI]